MKLITRSAIALVFLIGLATPLLAQNPDVAIRIKKPLKGCFPVTLTNLRGATVLIQSADLRVFDQKTCKLVCESREKLQKKLAPCKTLSFRICCDKSLPSDYICYVRVTHSNGMNEEWFFQP